MIEQQKTLPRGRGGPRLWVPPVLGLAYYLISKVGLLPGLEELTRVYMAIPLMLAVVGFSAFYFTNWPPLIQTLGAIAAFLVILKFSGWIMEAKPVSMAEQQMVELVRVTNTEMVIEVFQEGAQPIEVKAELKPCDRSRAAFPGYVLHGFTSHEGWNEFTLDLPPLHWSCLEESNPCFELHVYRIKDDGKKQLLGKVRNIQ